MNGRDVRRARKRAGHVSKLARRKARFAPKPEPRREPERKQAER